MPFDPSTMNTWAADQAPMVRPAPRAPQPQYPMWEPLFVRADAVALTDAEKNTLLTMLGDVNATAEVAAILKNGLHGTLSARTVFAIQAAFHSPRESQRVIHALTAGGDRFEPPAFQRDLASQALGAGVASKLSNIR